MKLQIGFKEIQRRFKAASNKIMSQYHLKSNKKIVNWHTGGP